MRECTNMHSNKEEKEEEDEERNRTMWYELRDMRVPCNERIDNS